MKAQSKVPDKILFVCGGSGGHIMPALSTANALKSKNKNISIFFITSKKAIDEKFFAQDDGFEKLGITAAKLPQDVISVFGFLCNFLKAFFQSISVILKFRPDIIVCYGGYIQAPVIIAGWLMRKPIIIHEQNVYPGKSNKIMAFFAKKIALSYRQTKDFFPDKNIVITGMPVNAGICSSKLTKNDLFSVLVIGGSQGARSLNRVFLDALECMDYEYMKRLHIVHISGEFDYEFVKNRSKKLGFDYEVYSFYKDMNSLYEKTDLVISRAGSSTLTEISACGLPSILLPYPYAGNHQYYNAKVFIENGAAVYFDERRERGSYLAGIIQDLMDDKQRLSDMSEKAALVMNTDGANKLADEILSSG